MEKTKLMIIVNSILILFFLIMVSYFIFYLHSFWGSLILLVLAFIDIIKVLLTYKDMKDRDKNGNN